MSDFKYQEYETGGAKGKSEGRCEGQTASHREGQAAGRGENRHESRRGSQEGGGSEVKGGSSSKGKKGRRNKELGRRGEEAAACYLERRGYDILERNWTCVAGEADLIATDGNYLVFVEVKTRSGTERGFPAEAVDAKKREKYERIAAIYLQHCPIADICVRFDVVSIISYGNDRAFIRHHINAFA